jgi:hypothetical protein
VDTFIDSFDYREDHDDFTAAAFTQPIRFRYHVPCAKSLGREAISLPYFDRIGTRRRLVANSKRQPLRG